MHQCPCFTDERAETQRASSLGKVTEAREAAVRLGVGLLLVPSLRGCQSKAPGEGLVGRLPASWSVNEAVMEYTGPRASKC